jgi:hypothetical protein
MQVQGKIKIIGDVQTFGNDFNKRQLVVITDDQYPQLISIDFLKDKCDLLNSYKVGQIVDVYINLGGREWINPQGESKYFNSITGWKIEALAQDISSLRPTSAPNLSQGVEDDLPF